MYKPFDLRTVIMISIGGGILAAMFLLIVLVLCLYSKISKALNSSGTAREADDDCFIDPYNNPHEKIIRAEACHPFPASTVAVGNCHPLQCCNAYGVYADVSSLPPCLCNSVKEGL
ncbi:protein FAM24A-like [Arvicanthis niloticus]|uniref:protein FAM24A-like n=1 Tax=Arvicanthis niloticus TaxID=61156 RepID=UPI001486BAFE|nr:protein FAM24A-like [Arvicanthis niloticus]